MARPLRIEFEGAVYHVTSRGNEKKEIFQDDEDRITFFNILKGVKERCNWLCHAYCLMDNHYHLVIETPEGNLSLGMRQLNGVYTQTYNNRHQRIGHLFQGRYKAILVEKESHLLEVCRYVVLNPVRASIVDNPRQWKWSSYRATGELKKTPSFLTTEWILGQFGKNHKEAARKYREFVKAGVGKESIWKDLKGQILLGGEEFVERFIDYIRDKREIKEIPRIQRYMGRPTLSELFNKDNKEVLKNKGRRDERIMEAIKEHGYNQMEVARFLNLHYSTVSRIVKGEEEKSKSKT